jgi:hypothetical protein
VELNGIEESLDCDPVEEVLVELSRIELPTS